MKIAATIFVGLFFVGSSIGYAEPHSSTNTMKMAVPALESWTAGDHLGAAKNYEEEARLLQAEVRGMETVGTKILPFLEVEAIKEAGVQKLIDRRLKEAEENRKLANFHYKEGMQVLAKKEAGIPVQPMPKVVTKNATQTSNVSTVPSYMKYDWIEEEAILGW